MKKQKFTKMVLALVVLLVFAVSGLSDVFARGGRSGGSRGFSRPSRSAPRKTTSKPRSSKPRSAKPRASKPKSSKRSTAAPKRTAAQQKSFEASKKNGTASMTKAQSMNKFKSNPAMQKKYTSKYASKPTTRPSHVPQTTRVGNTNVNINYNSSMGGYGYTNALGAFIMYDMMSDAIMRDRMMTHNNYLYAGHRDIATRPVVYRNTGVVILWTVIGLAFLVAVLVVATKK